MSHCVRKSLMMYIATIAMTIKCADGMYVTMSVCAKKKLHKWLLRIYFM